MIAALWGIVREKTDAMAVIDCHGVGYGVEMPTSSLQTLGDVGNSAHVYVHTHVAEDQLRLFGFCAQQERDVFVALIGTAGVGPKLALMMLSTLEADGICEAVHAKSRSALMQVPGVGGKKADRLLVDLEGRLPHLAPRHDKEAQRPLTPKASRAEEEVEGALLHLGFAAQQASAAARDVAKSAAPDADVTHMIRQALRQLTQSSSHHRNASYMHDQERA